MLRTKHKNERKRTMIIIVTIIWTRSTRTSFWLVLHLDFPIYSRKMAIPATEISFRKLEPNPSNNDHLHFQNTFQLFQFAPFLFDFGFGRFGLNFGQQISCNVQYFLQLFRSLQFNVSVFVAVILFENFKKPKKSHTKIASYNWQILEIELLRNLLWMPNFDFHFLFWGPVTVSYYRNDTTQFHHFAKCCRHNWRIVQLEWHRPRYMQCWRQFSQYHVAQYLGTIIVIFVRIFYKTKTVNITDKRFTVCSVYIYVERNKPRISLI